MAIITAVLVEVGGSIYAIPMSAVREILKEKDSILKTVGTRRVIMLRDEVLALVNLGAALQEGGAEAAVVRSAGCPCRGRFRGTQDRPGGREAPSARGRWSSRA